MDLTVHTYGYHDAIYYMLGGIAMFRNSGFYEIVLNMAGMAAALFYALKISMSGQVRPYIMKTFGMLALINGLLLPTTNMLVKDHVTKRIETVDNIPIAFALPVGILEEFGHLLTGGFEQAFAPINNNFDYYNYGMTFGARLKKELTNNRLKNPEFVGNMRAFIKQCIVLPAMIGYQFTPQQLASSSNIWKLVSDKAGVLTRVWITVNEVDKNVRCKEAVPYFENYFKEEHKRIFDKYKNTEYGYARTGENYNANAVALSKVFEKNIKAVYTNTTASDLLNQQMMIAALDDYMTKDAYGIARARSHQESSWMLSSQLATLYMPMLLVCAKCVIYASFIFLIPMLVFSGGMNAYRSYLSFVASLQLWPSLNAVINMIMGTYSNLMNEQVLSYSTFSTIVSQSDTIVSVAGGLMTVVPFLAYAISSGGISGMTQLANTVIGGLQATVSNISGEIVTGNRSLDNVSIGNAQIENKGGFKTGWDMQYVSGGASYYHDDGTLEKVTIGGGTIMQSGAGLTASSGATSYRLDDSRQAQISEGL